MTTRDKPKVERVVQYVHAGNFFAGEHFDSLAAAQEAATAWCTKTAGMRIHGTINARPLEVFNDVENCKVLHCCRSHRSTMFRRCGR